MKQSGFQCNTMTGFCTQERAQWRESSYLVQRHVSGADVLTVTDTALGNASCTGGCLSTC